MGQRRARALAGFACVLASLAMSTPAEAQSNLIVDGTTFQIGPSTQRKYDHICVINGGEVEVTPYAGGDKSKQGNLELIAGSVYVDATSKITARGEGYQARKCYHGDGPTAEAGGRGGCAVADSGGGGAHFGRGGRGTVDAPVGFPLSYEENCDDCSSGTCDHTWDPDGHPADDEDLDGVCTSVAECGTQLDDDACSDERNGRFCREGASVAGVSYWHDIYEPEFGAAGGDKGCRDGDGRGLVTGGAGGGRVVVVGLSHLTATATSPCGVNLPRGSVRIDGDIDASGKRGCGIENDSGGGGAGGTVLIVGENVTIGAGSHIAAAGGLGGDTFAGKSGQPDYQDCPGAQDGGTCDDCGGGGGGGIISVLSINSDIDPAAEFDVSGAAGGVCEICKGEAGGGAGELQLDGAYVGEFCDGYDNDFDGHVDEGLPMQSCGLGTCKEDIASCTGGEPVACEPTVGSDPSCTESPLGARPRIAVVLDTSASMLLSLDGYPTFGDGSLEQPGIDVDGDGEPNDSRLYLARTALAEVMSAYPEIEFALARYHQDQGALRNCQTASWFECQHLVASYDDPSNNDGDKVCDVEIGPGHTVEVKQLPGSPEECINYAGSCGPPRRGADVLSGFGMPVRDMVRWLDGREMDFRDVATPGNVCDHAHGGDCEVRGSGPTPLAGSLMAAEDYMVPIRTTDGAASCRDYSVILVTDGAESCNGDPVVEAARLHDTFDIATNVVAVSVLPEEEASLNAIAAAGGTGAAVFVNDPEQLVPALSTIIAGSIRVETCNNADDDCDGVADEGVPKFCDKPHGIKSTTLCEEPDESKCDGKDDDCDGTVDEGLLNRCGACGEEPAEACDGVDNDCDGRTDESTAAGACGSEVGNCAPGTLQCVGGALECRGEVPPSAETCDCSDDDCDGSVDEDPDGSLCGGGRCVGCKCITHCEPNDEFEPTCPAGLAPDLQENGECLCVQDNCDARRCGETMLERDGEVACAPDSDDVGTCLCRAGECTARCDGVTCDGGDVCDKRTGRCVEDNCRGLGCGSGELCDAMSGECVTDACAEVRCAAGEACRAGNCEKSCADVTCEAGERCAAGRCVADACAKVDCDDGAVCVGGECSDDACAAVSCADGLACAQASGECERDACWEVRCPSGQFCSAGECKRRGSGSVVPDDDDGEQPTPGGPDPHSRVLAAGGGGFSCAVAGGAPVSAPARPFGALLALLLVGWVGLRRRARARRRARGRRALLACAAALCALLLGGCQVTPFCLDCADDEGSAGKGGAGGSGGAAAALDGGSGYDDASALDGGADAAAIGSDSGLPAWSTCVPEEESCNGKDDDCDFRVDENVVAPDNDCDQLGVCADTRPSCVNAKFVCVYPAERQDDETRCDGKDNDCDGRTDESFDELGEACELGVGACTAHGKKVCDARGTGLKCDVGPLPKPSAEICDGVDNDCDGMVDEPRGEPGNDPSYVKDAMVAIGGGVFIYTYEASRPDASKGDQGTAAERACSKKGVQPWSTVSFTAAAAACEAAGHRLCTAAEWLAACAGDAGSTYPYGDTYAADDCNGADHDIDSDEGLQNGPLRTGDRKQCQSEAGAFDLAGNLKEWTDDMRGSAGGNPIEVVRGGSYESPALGMTCQTELSQQIATTALPSVGFRCCSDHAP
jgi:hypothetical protein